MFGPIRQELLSGIRESAQFEKLRTALAAFPDLPLVTDDYELAAEFFNACRSHGVQGSNTDFLLCAVSYRRDLPLLTTDDDFRIFAKYIPISLFHVDES
jgi:predicted nucleic acid-binding protein